jgi:hypothetical protein
MHAVTMRSTALLDHYRQGSMQHDCSSMKFLTAHHVYAWPAAAACSAAAGR